MLVAPDGGMVGKTHARLILDRFLGFVFWPEMVAGFKMIVRRSKNEK